MLKSVWRNVSGMYRRGLLLFVVAPAIVALAVVPEFVQHVAEIRLGMFDGIEHARAVANDSAR